MNYQQYEKMWTKSKALILKPFSTKMSRIDEVYNPQSSEIVKQDFVDFLCKQYRLDHYGMHGIEHWLRVLYNGRLIAKASGANLKVVELFCLLHDTQRKDEWEDPYHGQRAADYASSIRGEWFELSDAEMSKLTEALSLHSAGLISNDPTLSTCWDADRLDLARVGITPKKEYMSNSFSKNEYIISEAIKRSNIKIL